MNTETIKTWLKANKKDRHWLASQCGVHKQTVDGWLSAGRTIPAPSAKIIRGIMSKGAGVLNPRLTLEEYNQAQALAAQKGQSLEDWISELTVMLLFPTSFEAVKSNITPPSAAAP